MIVFIFSSIFAFFSNSCVFSPNPPPFFSNFSYPPRFGARSLLRTHVRPFGLYKRSYQPAHTSPPAPPPAHPAPPGPPRPAPTRPPPGPARPVPPGPARPAAPRPPARTPNPARARPDRHSIPTRAHPGPWPPLAAAGWACSRAARGRREGGASAACSCVRAEATAALRRYGGV